MPHSIEGELGNTECIKQLNDLTNQLSKFHQMLSSIDLLSTQIGKNCHLNIQNSEDEFFSNNLDFLKRKVDGNFQSKEAIHSAKKGFPFDSGRNLTNMIASRNSLRQDFPVLMDFAVEQAIHLASLNEIDNNHQKNSGYSIAPSEQDDWEKARSSSPHIAQNRKQSYLSQYSKKNNSGDSFNSLFSRNKGYKRSFISTGHSGFEQIHQTAEAGSEAHGNKNYIFDALRANLDSNQKEIDLEAAKEINEDFMKVDAKRQLQSKHHNSGDSLSSISSGDRKPKAFQKKSAEQQLHRNFLEKKKSEKVVDQWEGSIELDRKRVMTSLASDSNTPAENGWSMNGFNNCGSSLESISASDLEDQSLVLGCLKHSHVQLNKKSSQCKVEGPLDVENIPSSNANNSPEKNNDKVPKPEGENSPVPATLNTTANNNNTKVVEGATYLDQYCFTAAYNEFGTRLSGTDRAFEIKKNCESEINKLRAVHPLSYFQTFWDFFMSIVYLIVLTFIPVMTSYPKFDVAVSYVTISIILTTVYSMDVLIHFFKVARESNCILSLQTSRKIYLKKKFIVQVISLIPYSIIFSSWKNREALTIFYLIGVFELFRIFTKNPIYLILTARFQKKFNFGASFMSMFSLGLMLLIFLHLHGCFYFLCGRMQSFQTQSWKLLEKEGILAKSVGAQYTWSVFAAISNTFPVTGYRPTDSYEQWVTIVLVLIGATLYATLVGTISSFSFGLDSSGRLYKEKMDEVNEYLNYKKLSPNIKNRVKQYYELKFKGKYFNEVEILGELNNSLRQDIAIHNCRDLIRKVPFLCRSQNDGRDEAFNRCIASALQPCYYINGDRILEAGDVGNEMYFIFAGIVEILVGGKVVAKLNEGSFFGEVALLGQVPRTATIQAHTNCILFSLHRLDMEEILKDYEDMSIQMQEVYKERMEKVKKENEQKAKLLEEELERKKTLQKNVEQTEENCQGDNNEKKTLAVEEFKRKQSENNETLKRKNSEAVAEGARLNTDLTKRKSIKK
ncbi:hypothetical protein HDU92_001257 [Lobulomyces angularis]|nr:hypothetical protein HDU92_001257 [Lobulomyces angularis]